MMLLYPKYSITKNNYTPGKAKTSERVGLGIKNTTWLGYSINVSGEYKSNTGKSILRSCFCNELTVTATGVGSDGAMELWYAILLCTEVWS